MKKILILLVISILLITLFGCTTENKTKDSINELNNDTNYSSNETTNPTTENLETHKFVKPIQNPCQITLEEYSDSIKEIYQKKLIITEDPLSTDSTIEQLTSTVNCELTYQNEHPFLIRNTFALIKFYSEPQKISTPEDCSQKLSENNSYCESIQDGSMGDSALILGQYSTRGYGSHTQVYVESNGFYFEIISNEEKVDPNTLIKSLKNIATHIANNVKKLNPKNEIKEYIIKAVKTRTICDDDLENKLKSIYPSIKKISEIDYLHYCSIEVEQTMEEIKENGLKMFDFEYDYYINNESALIAFEKYKLPSYNPNSEEYPKYCEDFPEYCEEAPYYQEYYPVSNLGTEALFTKNNQHAVIVKDNLILKIDFTERAKTIASKEDLTKASEIILEALTTK